MPCFKERLVETAKRTGLRVGMLAYTEYLTDPRVRREAQALADRGDQVDFLCLRQPGSPSRRKVRSHWQDVDGVHVCYLPFKKYQGGNQIAYLLSYILFLFLSAFWLTGLYMRRRYQVIQVHTMPDFLIFAALVPRIFGCKLILDMHDLTSDLYSVKFRSPLLRPLVWGLRLQERLSAGLAHHVVTVHEPYRQVLIQRGIKPQKISVLMNAPDDRIFSMAVRETGKLPASTIGGAESFTLVYHGTIVARYGLDVMLRAVALLREHNNGNGPSLRLVVYGKGDDLPRLLALRSELGLDDVTYFHGKHVPLEQLPALLIQADLAVVPNLSNPFTDYVLPTKLMEYAAIGVPAVVARTPVVSQYFDDEMVSYFTPGDARDLAQRIDTLAHDPARRRALARNAHQRFTQRYNWTAIKQGYYALVDSLCRTGHAPVAPNLPAAPDLPASPFKTGKEASL
jgi:glycosyltransferase involved in cell wall biosynthesis